MGGERGEVEIVREMREGEGDRKRGGRQGEKR